MKYYVQFTSIMYIWNSELPSHILNKSSSWKNKYKGWPEQVKLPDGKEKESQSHGP